MGNLQGKAAAESGESKEEKKEAKSEETKSEPAPAQASAATPLPPPPKNIHQEPPPAKSVETPSAPGSKPEDAVRKELAEMVQQRRSKSVLEGGAETDGAETDVEERFLGIPERDRNPSPTFHLLQRSLGDEAYLPAQPHEPLQARTYSPGPDMRRSPVPIGISRGEIQSRQSSQRQMEHMRQAQEEADWRAADLQHTQTYLDDRPKHYPTGAQVAPSWRGVSGTHRQIEDTSKHYAAGSEVQADWQQDYRPAASAPAYDIYTPKHYPTGSERRGLEARDGVQVAPNWQHKSEEMQRRARSTSRGYDYEQRHYPADDGHSSSYKSVEYYQENYSTPGAEVEADWRDQSLSKTRSGGALQFNDRPKHYPTGSEVEPDWRAGGLRPGFDYEPKHYPAGAEVRADWADRALNKSKRWESWGHSINETQPKHYPAGQEVQADWEQKSAQKASKWDQQYSSYHGTSANQELYQPSNTYQPPPPRPQHGLQVNVEVDRGGVVYSPAGGLSPRYRSRSVETRSSRSRNAYHSADSRYHLAQAHAPNIDSIRGGRDGPAPILTLHRDYDYRGRPSDVRDQGTYFGPTAGWETRRSVSRSERYGPAPPEFTGPRPGTQQYWDEMGAQDYRERRSQSTHSVSRVTAAEDAERREQWRREMESQRVNEAESRRRREEEEARWRAERAVSEQRRQEARWKEEAYRRQEEEERRRQETLRVARARSEQMEHEEETRRARSETRSREEMDARLRAEQEELERKKRQESLHREQQRLDEEWRLAERERQKHQMGTDFLYLTQRGQPRDFSTSRRHAASNQRSQSSHSFRSSSATRYHDIARDERRHEIKRETPKSFASTTDLRDARSTTPGSIYAIDASGKGSHLDSQRTSSWMRRTEERVSSRSPAPAPAPRPISPRPVAIPSGGGTSSYNANYQSSYSHSSSYQGLRHEEEARRQKLAMEEELRQRQANSSQQRNTTTTTNYSSGPVVSSYSTYNANDKSGSMWQKTGAGANTKASSTGEFLDKEGNRVSYTKEMYTSSDPGKEFSMLTQEEKKVLEAPVEPGVISRHVTTKYYKKSTYSSTSTTSTTSTPPAIASSFTPGDSATTRVVRSPAPVY